MSNAETQRATLDREIEPLTEAELNAIRKLVPQEPTGKILSSLLPLEEEDNAAILRRHEQWIKDSEVKP